MADMQIVTMQKGDLLILANRSTFHPLSPLNKLPKSSDAITNEGTALGSNAAVMSSIVILSQPAWIVTVRMGGSDYPVQELILCGNTKGSPVIGLRPSQGDYVDMIHWESGNDFAKWLCNDYACKNEVIVPNFIPPSCSIEAFLMLLHSIDAYKRAYMLSLLNHRPSDSLELTSSEFNESCHSGIKNHDVRWLAPAFISLVPGFGEYRLQGDQQSIQTAFDRNFLVSVQAAPDTTQMVGFGEAGRSMGLEFARTWLMGIGLETRVATPNGSQAVSRCFIAPTGLTNHFVDLTLNKEGAVSANHQPLAYGKVVERVMGIINNTMKLSAAPPVTQAPSPQMPIQPTQMPIVQSPVQANSVMPQAPTSQSSAQAGSALPATPSPQASGVSGTVEQAYQFCHQCGQKLPVELKFCSHCGAKQ